MTDYEVFMALRSLTQGRSMCLHCDYWHHEHPRERSVDRMGYSASVHPGFDGTTCQLFSGETSISLIDLVRWASQAAQRAAKDEMVDLDAVDAAVLAAQDPEMAGG